MTREQAAALVQRADLAVSEATSAVHAARIALQRAEAAERQAREQQGLVREIVKEVK